MMPLMPRKHLVCYSFTKFYHLFLLSDTSHFIFIPNLEHSFVIPIELSEVLLNGLVPLEKILHLVVLDDLT